MKRSANTIWEGSLEEGKGTFTVASGAHRRPRELPISKVLDLDISLDLKIVN